MEPFFSVSWMITWFSHELSSFEAICRIFDVMLSETPYMTIYLSAALLIINETQIFQKTQNETSSIHHFISGLPNKFIQNENDAQKIVNHALLLFQNFPPKFLMRKISNLNSFSPFLLQFSHFKITPLSYQQNENSFLLIYPYFWFSDLHDKDITLSQQNLFISQIKSLRENSLSSSSSSSSSPFSPFFIYFLLFLIYFYYFYFKKTLFYLVI